MAIPAHNPFQMPGSGDPLPDAPRADGEVEPVDRVEKPWGHEEIVAVLDGSYVGKVLHITAGGVLSLQLHRRKHETIAVQAGRIRVEFGPDRHRLRTVTLEPGERLLLRAEVVHRISADVDSVVLETSTARPGWREDVVRLDDRYGRRGTNAP